MVALDKLVLDRWTDRRTDTLELLIGSKNERSELTFAQYTCRVGDKSKDNKIVH